MQIEDESSYSVLIRHSFTYQDVSYRAETRDTKKSFKHWLYRLARHAVSYSPDRTCSTSPDAKSDLYKSGSFRLGQQCQSCSFR